MEFFETDTQPALNDYLAGRVEDLAAAAPSYGRAPNARKPTPSP